LGTGRQKNPLYHDLLGGSLTPVPVQRIHLNGEQCHQLTRQAEICHATCGGLIDVKCPPGRVHCRYVRRDDLPREHRLQLVPRANSMEDCQYKVCDCGIDRLRGVRVNDIEDLLEERLGDNALRCPERAEESRLEFLDLY
jgi:hypothetical protein